MKNGYAFIMLALGTMLLAAAGCQSNADKDNPKDLLDRFFLSSMKRDYAAVYDCYYAAFRRKTGKDEYIRRSRAAASAPESYAIGWIQDNGNAAEAWVKLTFNPPEKQDPVTTAVTEDLVLENGKWKIKGP